MTDFTHHNPRVITDAESVEALAAEWPEQRPVSSEQTVEAILALVREYVVAFVDGLAEDKPSSDPVRVEAYAKLKTATYALVSERDELNAMNASLREQNTSLDAKCARLEKERDALAGRVRELEADARRYEWLREQHEGEAESCCVFAPNDMRECLVPVGSLPGELDEFIDAALTTPESKP